MNAAVPLPCRLADVLEDEYILIASRHVPESGETYMTGTAVGYDKALRQARLLVAGGWKVVIDPADPHDCTAPRITFEPFK